MPNCPCPAHQASNLAHALAELLKAVEGNLLDESALLKARDALLNYLGKEDYYHE